MFDVPFRAGIEIVDAQDVVPIGNKPVAEVRAEETGSAGDKDGLLYGHIEWSLW